MRGSAVEGLPRPRREPVALVLEGVGGKLCALRAAALEQGAPVELDSGAVRCAEEVAECVLLVAVRAQGGGDQCVVVVEAAVREAREHGVGAELEEARDALGG